MPTRRLVVAVWAGIIILCGFPLCVFLQLFLLPIVSLVGVETPLVHKTPIATPLQMVLHCLAAPLSRRILCLDNPSSCSPSCFNRSAKPLGMTNRRRKDLLLLLLSTRARPRISSNSQFAWRALGFHPVDSEWTLECPKP